MDTVPSTCAELTASTHDIACSQQMSGSTFLLNTPAQHDPKNTSVLHKVSITLLQGRAAKGPS